MAAYKAWLVAPKGRGTERDAQAIQVLTLDPAPTLERVRPHKPDIVRALHALAAHDGPRLFWLVGDACFDDPDWSLRTDCASDGLRLGAIGDLLAKAADNYPAPLIAIIDVCHAGLVRPANPPDNLALFLACDHDELTRADDDGGWLTRTLIEGLATLSGDIKLQALDAWLTDQRDAQALGTQWPHAVLGRLRTHVLHRRPDEPARPQVRRSAPPAADPIAAWKRHMRALHKDLFPIFDVAVAAEEVFVELELAFDDEPGEAAVDRRQHLRFTRRGFPIPKTNPGPLTLAKLMAQPGRFAVLGEPGAGKSTLARHLTWSLAHDGGRVPVYLPLPAFARSEADTVWDFAAALLKRDSEVEPAALAALPSALRTAPVLLLLDGLDEVAGGALDRVRELLRTLPTHLTHVAVFSRPTGYEALPGYTMVRVRPLDAPTQQRLLARWLQDEASARTAWQRLQSHEALRELAGYPLLLTLIALLWREHQTLPLSRVDLYTQALDQLLQRGYSATRPEAVPHPHLARRVLRHLSLALQVQGGEQWEFDELARALRLLEQGQVGLDAEVVEDWRQEKERWEASEVVEKGPESLSLGLAWWQRLLIVLRLIRRPALPVLAGHQGARDPGPEPVDPQGTFVALHGEGLASLVGERDKVADTREGFLELVGARSGVVAAHDGRGQPWRYLHRALRDALCAEQLAAVLKREPAVITAFAAHLRSDRQVGRWAETFALLCAAAPAPQPLVEALIEASSRLGRRALAETDGLPPPVILSLLVSTRDWDGEDLLRLALRWRKEPQHLDLIRALATPNAELDTVARVHYALSAAECLGDEPAFFAAAGRPMPARCPVEKWAPIPGGTFRMGTAEGGHDDESPVHEVTLSAFELGTYAVTRVEFARLSPGHECPGGERHPVTEVSWYVARLFAHWAGGRLPTEAEWEYACRAGATTAFSFGDAEEKLGEYGWFNENAGRQTHPVGEKRANPWGLYDMHGNVVEWCGDWFGEYPAVHQSNPSGPASGLDRVRRGGAGWSHPSRCRSAYRGRFRPDYRDGGLGFRVLRPPREAHVRSVDGDAEGGKQHGS